MVNIILRHAEISPKSTIHLSRFRQHPGLGAFARRTTRRGVGRRMGMAAAAGEEGLRKEPPGHVRVAPRTVPPGMPAKILALSRAHGRTACHAQAGHLLMLGIHGADVVTLSPPCLARASQRFTASTPGRNWSSVSAASSPCRVLKRSIITSPFTCLAPLVRFS